MPYTRMYDLSTLFSNRYGRPYNKRQTEQRQKPKSVIYSLHTC